MTINKTCPFCGIRHSVSNVDPKGYSAWQSRAMLIQDALPTLSKTERESLISGVCPTCQTLFFDEE